MKKYTAPLLALTLTLAAAVSARAAGTLDIYWTDMEGGAGTLIVTPAGESVLIDTGNPSRRAKRTPAPSAFTRRPSPRG